MKDIKIRIRSMESTKQITKAMEMVATSQLRHAQEKVTRSRPYFETLYETVTEIAATNKGYSSEYFTQRQVKQVCYVVIAGDRGLAGGYNHNILKLVAQELAGKQAQVLPIGKKALEYCHQHDISIVTDAYAQAADVSVGDCFTMAKDLAKAFRQGTFDEVYVGYTNFASILVQTPCTMKLLPLAQSLKAKSSSGQGLRLYEPGVETVLQAIIPEYLGGLIYGALCESVASELGARRTAMDAATKNAEEMIADLNLKYNRARQGAITQEITEIVAGAEE